VKKVRIESGQTLLDIAVQELADTERLFEIANINELSITDLLTPGNFVVVPDFAPDKKKIVRIFLESANKPASEIESHDSGLIDLFKYSLAASPFGIYNGLKQVRIESGQSLIDIVIQEVGDAERLFEIAGINEMGITDLLNPGSVILVPDYAQDKKAIVLVFSDPSIKPASESIGSNIDSELGGISYWGIYINFVIS